MNTKHVSLVLLFYCLFIPVVSCEKQDGNLGSVVADEQDNQNENILRYDVTTPFTSLNPISGVCSGSNHIFPLLYSYLFVPDERGELKSDLARKWVYDPGTLTWTIYLRKDAFFHNKQPVTSQDVKYSAELYLKNSRPSSYSLIDRVSTSSDNVISIRLKIDDPGFLKKIWDMEIIPHNRQGRKDFWDHPIGSGPFKFKSRKGEKEVCLEASDNYFNGKPALDGVVFFCQPDKEKAWTRILSGATDIAQEISPKNYEMMRDIKKRYYFDLYTLRFYTVLLFNTTDPQFSDPRVRMALSHAIDRAYIVKEILMGMGVVAVGPMGVDSPYHNPEVSPVPFNPQEGLTLIKEAGWYYGNEGRYLEKEGNVFEFTILVFKESQIEKKVAQYLKLCLNDIGIKVHLQSLPFKELQRRYFRNNEFQAVLTEIRGAYRNPEFLKDQWCPDISRKSKAGSFEHIEVVRLFNKALQEKDSKKQKEFYFKIDALITSLQPGTFLFHKTAINVISKRFTLPAPFSLTHEGIYRLRHASLDKKSSVD